MEEEKSLSREQSLELITSMISLIIVAVVPQIIISMREGRRRGFKTREGDMIGGIWFSYGIAIFVFSYIDSYLNIGHDVPIYLTLCGIPTFATGYGRRFRPMILGGLAWFIPGLLLRRCYLKAKRQHV
jgi:hypothetical protein